MSNAELVHAMYDSFRRGDVQSILARLDENVSWETFGPPDVLPYAGALKGPGEVVRFFEALGTTQAEQVLTIEETYAVDDQVITVGHYAGIVIATGKRFDVKLSHFFTIRNGKVTRLLHFLDSAAAAESYTPSAVAARA